MKVIAVLACCVSAAYASNLFSGLLHTAQGPGYGPTAFNNLLASDARLTGYTPGYNNLGLQGAHQGTGGYSDNDGYGAGIELHGNQYKHEKKEYGQIVLNDKFTAYDPHKMNPRSPHNTYKFEEQGDLRIDRANIKQNKDHVQLTALPHTRDSEQGPQGLIDRLEYFITTNDALDDALTPSMYGGSSFRFTVSTQVHGARKHLFPRGLVTDPDSDYRLATGVVGIQDPVTGMFACFLTTNDAIWIGYLRNPVEFDQDTGSNPIFFQTKKVAYRKPYDIDNLRIDWDKQRNSYTWFVNGYQKGEIEHIGLPSNKFRHMVDYTNNDYEEVYPELMKPIVCSVQFMDHFDPNSPAGQTALVQLLGADQYANNVDFFDTTNDYTLRKFGQGTVTQLYKMKIVVANNKPHH